MEQNRWISFGNSNISTVELFNIASFMTGYEKAITGGKMNAACMFWDNNGNKTLSYNPESRNWKAISTEEEFARARVFTSIYNDELARLKKEYGKNAKGTVSYQQIQSDLAVSMKAPSSGSSLDIQI